MAFSTFSSINKYITASSSSSSSTPTTANLIYYYKFILSDINGNNLKNYASGSYDSVLYPSESKAYSTVSNFGKSGKGSLFAYYSSGGIVEVNNYQNFTSNGLSISFWVCGNGSGSQFFDMFSFSSNGQDTAQAIMMELHPTSNSSYISSFYLYVYNNSSLNIQLPSNTYLNNSSTWYNVCICLGSSANVYINKTNVYSVTNYNFTAITWPSNCKFYIGCGGNGWGDNMSSAGIYLDEFRIYNSTLAISDVNTIYSYGGGN